MRMGVVTLPDAYLLVTTHFPSNFLPARTDLRKLRADKIDIDAQSVKLSRKRRRNLHLINDAFDMFKL